MRCSRGKRENVNAATASLSLSFFASMLITSPISHPPYDVSISRVRRSRSCNLVNKAQLLGLVGGDELVVEQIVSFGYVQTSTLRDHLDKLSIEPKLRVSDVLFRRVELE